MRKRIPLRLLTFPLIDYTKDTGPNATGMIFIGNNVPEIKDKTHFKREKRVLFMNILWSQLFTSLGLQFQRRLCGTVRAYKHF